MDYSKFTGSDGKEYTWIDGDTFTDGENRYRVKGYNAPETLNVVDDDKVGLRFKKGQYGGKETTKAVERIANAGQFKNILDTGEVDEFGRKIISLTNDKGEDLTTALYKSGALDIHEFTDEKYIRARDRGRLEKEMTGKLDYDLIINEELGDIKSSPVVFKESALNEREYLNSVIFAIADQKGLNLNDDKDFRTALSLAQDKKYDEKDVDFYGIDLRSGDRTKENVALNQLSTAWNQGWAGMKTGLLGFAELSGVGIGSKRIAEWGKEGVELAKDDLLNAPALKNIDYRDISGVFDGWQFMVNNMTMSAPYLITLVGGGLAAPFTGGASAYAAYGSVAGSYAGQVWNDIKGPKGRKEAAGSLIAGTGMALLDRLGIAGFGIKPSSVLTKEGLEEVVQKVKQVRGISIDEARKVVDKAGRGVIKEAIEGIGDFSADNIQNANKLRRILLGSGRGAITEGVTEALQEGTGYLASGSMSEGGLKQNFNPNEFLNLLTQSAVAGSALGSGFGAAGSIIDIGDRYAMERGLRVGKSTNPYNQVRDEFGDDTTVDNILDNINSTLRQKDKPTESDINPLTLKATQGKEQLGSLWDRIKDPVKFVPRLYRGATTTIFRPELLRKSPALRKLYALGGQLLGKIHSGRDVQAEEAITRANFLRQFDPRKIFARFNMTDTIPNSQKISEMIRRYDDLIKEGKPIDADLVKYESAIKQTIEDLKKLNDDLYTVKNGVWRSQYNSRKINNLNVHAKDPDAWRNSKSHDWSKVRDNREEFIDFVMKNGGVITDKKTKEVRKINRTEAIDMYNRVSNNEDATPFSIVEGIEYVPGRVQGTDIELNSVPGFEKFANDNVLQNAINDINQISKYYAYTTYFGAGGRNIDYLLEQAKNDGIDEETINEIAYGFKSMVDAGTGNFNPIQNTKIKNFVNTGSFYMATIGLPLSALASFPEFAMLIFQSRNLSDVKKAIGTAIGEMVNIFKKVAKMDRNNFDSEGIRTNFNTGNQEKLIRGGFYPDDATVATRLGMGETDITKAWWQKQFFKYSGIAGLTQVQRASAAAGLTGFVSDRLKVLAVADLNKMNQDQLDAYTALTDIGLDVPRMVQLFNRYNTRASTTNGKSLFELFADNRLPDDIDPNLADAITKDRLELDEMMDTAMWYFTVDRIQTPLAYNRPLFFQDPHYQLFVQFNGFISTFTANIVPRLWNDYIKNGSPKMKYNTFAMIVTMMALAGASQWLKDFIKFGGSTPYLSNMQLLQRALMASGVLGSGERIVQAALPLYQSRDEGIFERIFGETLGTAPGVRAIGTATKAIGALGQGETERAVGQGTKLIPLVGPITPLRNMINNFIHGKPLEPYPFQE